MITPPVCGWSDCGAPLAEESPQYAVKNQSAWTTLDFSHTVNGIKWLGYVKYHKLCGKCKRMTPIRKPILQWNRFHEKAIPVRRKQWEKIKAEFKDSNGAIPG